MKTSVEKIKSDVLSSVVVFFVALPLCLGIAMASGVPPAAGLITGIVGGLIVSALGGCSLQVSGPAAGLTVIVYGIVQEHGIVMLGPIVLLAGFFQLLAGSLKGGQWFRAISPSIIFGMLGGIGILLFASQFHVMVDNHPRGNGWQNLISIPETIYPGLFPLEWSKHEAAATIGLITIVTMMFWHKVAPKKIFWMPSALVAVILGAGIANIWNFPVEYIQVPDSLIGALTFPDWASLKQLGAAKFLLEALALAFVASAETLFSASAVERLRPGLKTKHDRELFAQGVGNMICGFFGALPMTGVIVRSAANVNSGAQTRLSGFLHGIWLLLLVCFFPKFLELVPKSCLAAILVYTGVKLISIESIRKMYSYGALAFGIYLITMITIVVEDLLTGVIVGLALSMAKLVYLLTHLGIRVEKSGNVNHVYLSGVATFIRLPYLTDTLDALPVQNETHIHFEGLNYIDHACLDALTNWQQMRHKEGGKVILESEELIKMYNLKNAISGAPKVKKDHKKAILL